MLARSGPIPTRGDWSFEVGWDGFRAIVSPDGDLRVRSWRTGLVPELAGIPVRATLDSELVAFGLDDSPDFPLLGERMWPSGSLALSAGSSCVRRRACDRVVRVRFQECRARVHEDEGEGRR
jgi:ATP-dependent DNA ligase